MSFVDDIGGPAVAGLLGVGSLAGGCLVYAYVIWPAMTENDDLSQLHNLGAWLLTFLVVGEATVLATAVVGGAVVLGLGACVYYSCKAATGNDNTPDPIQNSEQAKRLSETAKALHATLATIKDIKANPQADEKAVDAEIIKVSQSLLDKGVLKSDEKPVFEKQLRDIVNGTLSAENVAVLNERVEAVKSTSPQTWSGWASTTVKNSVARVTDLFRRTAPVVTQAKQEQKQQDATQELEHVVVHRV